MAISVGTLLIIRHAATPGAVIACCFATIGGSWRLGFALPQLRALQNARLAAAEIFAVIDRVCWKRIEKFQIESTRFLAFWPLHDDPAVLPAKRSVSIT